MIDKSSIEAVLRVLRRHKLTQQEDQWVCVCGSVDAIFDIDDAQGPLEHLKNEVSYELETMRKLS